ncbi:heparan-alpha-glucosaminide N-acetyltransferase [Psychromonas sp. KJ10-2]|uniref:heparan-alpha-glucosaminide N-acetyltransferase n=1 Tax=Psychromonas sp. KJ10-2 TaxID=3391822 RepID=UPI0039B4F78D
MLIKQHDEPQIKHKKRIFEVDLLRGSAIVLMVIFHFCYNLAVFDWWDINTSKQLEWQVFRRVIVSGFLLAVGMSSYLAYSQQINWFKLTKSTGKLIAVAWLITVGSIFMYPNAWIYFGIIHFIAVALPIAAVFSRFPNTALLLGVSCLISYQMGWLSMKPIWVWSVYHLNIPTKTMDLASFIPWIASVLIGIYLMHKSLFNLKAKNNKFTNTLARLGQHSLAIYILHQPIMYGIMFAITMA